MPKLSITSPYVHARVDSNTFTMGNPMPESTLTLCQSRPYSGTLDLAFGLALGLYPKWTGVTVLVLCSNVLVLHCKKRLEVFWTYSRPGRVWYVTFRLGTGKPLTCFYSVCSNVQLTRLVVLSMHVSISCLFNCCRWNLRPVYGSVEVRAHWGTGARFQTLSLIF